MKTNNEIKFLIFEMLAHSPEGEIKIKHLMDKYEKTYPVLSKTIKEMITDNQICLIGEPIYTIYEFPLFCGDTIKYYDYE